MEKKKKISLFLKLFLWMLVVTAFSNFLLSFTIYKGYQGIFSPAIPYLPSDLYKKFEIGIENTWILVGILFFLILVFNTIFVVIFINSILGPLNKLLEGMEKVRKGDLQAQVKAKTGDEIEELANGFNQMVRDLQMAKEALEEEKKVLEIKVQARTRELRELNEALEEEVKKRTKELRQRVEELEKFHNLTVGREMKMLELKEEIERLKEELKKYKIEKKA